MAAVREHEQPAVADLARDSAHAWSTGTNGSRSPTATSAGISGASQLARRQQRLALDIGRDRRQQVAPRAGALHRVMSAPERLLAQSGPSRRAAFGVHQPPTTRLARGSRSVDGPGDEQGPHPGRLAGPRTAARSARPSRTRARWNVSSPSASTNAPRSSTSTSYDQPSLALQRVVPVAARVGRVETWNPFERREDLGRPVSLAAGRFRAVEHDQRADLRRARRTRCRGRTR